MQNNLDILKNKTNSKNMSSAKNSESKLKKFGETAEALNKIGGKAKDWHDGLRSESGFQRVQTIGDIVATIMAGA